MPDIRAQRDLLAIGLASLVFLLLAWFSLGTWLRAILGVPFLGFLPGYVAISALWPAGRALDWPARIGLSIGLSVAVVTLVGLLMLGLGLRSHLDEPYYHVVDDRMYEDFVWVRDNVGAEYRTAVLNTGDAWAFAPLTGKYVFAAEAVPHYTAEGRSAMAFLASDAKDSLWLRDHGISIVYTPGDVLNEDLELVHERVYVVRQ